MRRLAVPALLALAVLALRSAPAHADGTYFTMGFGPGEVSDELGDRVRSTFHGRFALGHRLGNVAVEGYFAPESDTETESPYSLSLIRLGVDARYVLPVSKGLQVYVRGGVSKLSATLGSNDEGRYAARDYEGRGLGGGAGVQLRGKVRALGFLYWPLFFIPAGPKVDAAIFIDHGVEFARLHAVTGPDRSIDARFTRLTIGFNVGADF